MHAPACTRLLALKFSAVHGQSCDAGIIVPPLPEKSAVQKFQMTSEFIEQRRRALQVFINRVVTPVMYAGLHTFNVISLVQSPCICKMVHQMQLLMAVCCSV